jgi:Tfp pilus assembly ATPase PilU
MKFRDNGANMAGMYSIKDLLTVVEKEGAQELRLHVGKPPIMVLHGEERRIDVPPLSIGDATELFRSIATVDQSREFQQCGDIHFIYVPPNSARFAVTASLKGEEISMMIRNLG